MRHLLVPRRVLIVNAPRVVASLWNHLIAPMLPESARQKTRILSEGESAAALAELIEPEQLPAFLGGARPDDDAPVPLAREVPPATVSEWRLLSAS